MVKIDSAIERRCQGKAADLAFSEEKPTFYEPVLGVDIFLCFFGFPY
jgi:hypothetical protein